MEEMPMRKFSMTALLILGCLAGLRAQEPAAKAEPERYNGMIMVMGARGSGVIRVKITLERLSTDDERRAYRDALKAKGSDGLAQAMEKITVGYIQFDQNLRYPLAYAIKVPKNDGTMIRVATNRPMTFTEQMQGFVSKDYQIGVAEFTLPKEGPGEGIAIGAAKVEFNGKGQLNVTTLPQNTGPQKITQIEREPTKSK
jgi:hypothetical protein